MTSAEIATVEADPRDPDPNGDGWTITRPCCGASGVLKRPANEVHIPHKRGCRYAKRK